MGGYRQTDGLMDRWLGGWVDGFESEPIDGWTERGIGRWQNEQKQ